MTGNTPHPTATRAGQRIAAEVSSWPGVTAGPHRFGGTEFRLGRRELGHLHGDRFADLPFPRRDRDQLIAAGRARPHHVLPDSGWVTAPIQSDDVEPVIELFRMAYERASAAAERRSIGSSS
jgi:Luciferase